MSFFGFPPDVIESIGFNEMFASAVKWNSEDELKVNYLVSAVNLKSGLDKLKKGDEFRFELWSRPDIDTDITLFEIFEKVDSEIEIQLGNGQKIYCEVHNQKPFGGLGYAIGVTFTGKIVEFKK